MSESQLIPVQFESLRFEKQDGVAIITLNRPEAANGINLSMAEELLKTAIACSEDDSIRAVVITGEGKMFCAGGDLKSFATFGEELPSALKLLTTNLHSAISRFARMNAPVIVAVNGVAAGAGLSLSVCGDMVFAAESSKFTMAYTAAGLSPDGSSSYFLPRLIGVRKTQELMLTNRRLSAAEALEWGLINKVIADDALLDEAMSLAKSLAQGPTQAFGMVKKLMLSTFSEGLESQMEIEAQGIVSMAKGKDGKEGISAFVNKRKPEFTGV